MFLRISGDGWTKLPNYTAGLLTHTGRYGQGWDDAVAAVHDLMVKTLRDHTKPKEKKP